MLSSSKEIDEEEKNIKIMNSNVDLNLTSELRKESVFRRDSKQIIVEQQNTNLWDGTIGFMPIILYSHIIILFFCVDNA